MAIHYTENLVPVMGGNSNGSITISASGYSNTSSADNLPWKAFDRNVTVGWYCNAVALPPEGSHWLKVDFGKLTKITKMTLICLSTHYSVKNFILQAYDAADNTWKNIYTGLNTKYDGTKLEFVFNNKFYSRYYRILVIDSYSSYGKTYCGAAEMELMSSFDQFLIQQDNDIYCIKNGVAKIGYTPTEEMFDKFCVHDLNVLIQNLNTNIIMMNDDGSLGVGKQFSCSLNDEILSLNSLSI